MHVPKLVSRLLDFTSKPKVISRATSSSKDAGWGHFGVYNVHTYFNLRIQRLFPMIPMTDDDMTFLFLGRISEHKSFLAFCTAQMPTKLARVPNNAPINFPRSM